MKCGQSKRIPSAAKDLLRQYSRYEVALDRADKARPPILPQVVRNGAPK
jgi:hypothetical protein